MIPYDRNKPIISIHIPKCAGTSFTEVLRSWYGDKLRLHYFNEVENRMPVKYDLAGGQGIGVCVHGHFNKERRFGIQDYYPEVSQFITVLRDPFAVCMSNYRYVQDRQEKKISYREGKPYSLDEFERYISSTRSYMLLHMPFEMTMGNYKDIIDTSFVYVGICEDLQTSVDRLAARLGFSSMSMPHLNKAERDVVVPDDLREAFIERHPVEYAIYRYARDIYGE